MIELWVEKYRPKDVESYIFQDTQVERQIKSWIAKGSTDNILLSGPPGVGKTSLCGVLMNELEVDFDSDVLWLNASREGNVETMRAKVRSFIASGGWGGMKYVVLDEADGMSQPAQYTLKADMEEFSDSVRWILTANAKNKIIPALQDRCVKLDILKPDEEKFTARMAEILYAEGVSMDTEDEIDALEAIISMHYPSLRGCIRDLQRYTVNGKLEHPKSTEGSQEWKLKAWEMFKKGSILEARNWLCANVPADEVENVMVWIYSNLELFEESLRDDVIIIVADGLYRHGLVANTEINLSATLTKLGRL